MDIPDVLKSVVEEARADLSAQEVTQQKRAELEHNVWEKVKVVPWNRPKQYEFLKYLYGALSHESQSRAILYNAGKYADYFWPRVNCGEMALDSAAQLLRRAKAEVLAAEQAGTAIDLDTAIKRVVLEYDRLPSFRNKKGHIVRRKSSVDLPRLRAEKISKKQKPKAKKEETPKDFWGSIRTTVSAFVAPRFEGIDPIVSQKLYMDFERDLKILLDEYGQKISRSARKEKDDLEVSVTLNRSEIISACRTLCIEPPRPGRPIELAKANQQKKKLARQYHPDRMGGSEVTRHLYEEVIKAYEVAEQYSEMYGKVES